FDLLLDAEECVRAWREAEALVYRGEPPVEIAAMRSVGKRCLPHGDFGDRRVKLRDGGRSARRGDVARILLRDPAIHGFDLVSELGKPALDIGLARGRAPALREQRFQPAVEPVDRGLDLIGRAVVLRADFSNQGVDTVGETVDRIDDRGLLPRAAAGARMIAFHQAVEPVGNVVELVLQPAVRAVWPAGKFALARAAADRGLQPFADGEPGAARGFACGVPSLGFDRIDAPGDIVTHEGTHQGVRDAVSCGVTPKLCTPVQPFHFYSKYAVNLPSVRSRKGSRSQRSREEIDVNVSCA